MEAVEKNIRGDEDLICLVADDIQIDRTDWLQDAVALLKRHPDAVMIGGSIRNTSGVIQSAGYVLGFEGDCGCPDRGRPVVDPGYFTQLKKQRSVSAVSSQFAVMRASFFRDLYRSADATHISIAFLGAWAGALALRTEKRIIYSPFLSSVSDVDWDALVTQEERARFREINGDILPDQRFYSRCFGVTKEFAYQPVSHPVRREQ
jgi:hypothetical protein